MAHMWQRFKKGLHSAGKVAAGIGAIAVAAHGIHKGLQLHGEVAAQRHGMNALHEYRAQQMARDPGWRNRP